MGTFCGLLKAEGSSISVEKREEFFARIRELFYRGGMMDWDLYTLFDKKLKVLKQPIHEKNGIYYSYNYFEDAAQPYAGFNTDRFEVYSDKVGYGKFSQTMLAAYTLEGLYTPGPFTIKRDNEWLSSWYYTGWINYLFGEKYLANKSDPWEICLMLHKDNKRIEKDYLRFRRHSLMGFIGYLEIMAVVDGLKELSIELTKAQDEYESDVEYSLRKQVNDIYVNIHKYISSFKANSKLSLDEQIDELFTMIRSFYTHGGLPEILESLTEDETARLEKDILLYDSPASVIKIIADVYEQDFWQLWQRIADVAKRYLWNMDLKQVPLVSTEEFFDVTADDLLWYWKKDKPIAFSDEMQAWLNNLKKEYDALLTQGVDMNSPLKRIMNIIDFAEEHYANIYYFIEIIYETFERISDPKFFALWLVFEKILHNADNINASKGLFEPDYWAKDDKDYVANGRRVCDTWWSVGRELKFNLGRKNVRRYIALMANKDLRNEIFRI